MARQTIGRKGHYKNERDNSKETKNAPMEGEWVGQQMEMQQ